MSAPRCCWCPDLASLRVDSGVFLCSACWEKLADKIRIIDPSTSVRDTAGVAGVTVAAPNPAPGPDAAAVTNNSQSTLAPAMAVDTAIAPQLADPVVAVAVNNSNPAAKEPEANARYPDIPSFLDRRARALT